jgi:hypothetical protein
MVVGGSPQTGPQASRLSCEAVLNEWRSTRVRAELAVHNLVPLHLSGFRRWPNQASLIASLMLR